MGKNHLLTLAIESKDGSGQKLLTYFDSSNAYIKDKTNQWIFVKQCRTIRPSFVRKLILKTLENGWQPNSRLLPPFVIAKSPTLISSVDKEELPSNAIIPNELLGGYLLDILDEVSLCPKWRKIILESPFMKRYPAPTPTPGFGKKEDHQMVNEAKLNFVVFNDGISPCNNWFVIGVQCVEFPEHAVYSTNGANVWIGE